MRRHIAQRLSMTSAPTGTLASGAHELGDLCGARPPSAFQHARRVDARHLANEVDSILERPSELCLVVIDLMLAATTAVIRIAQVSTRTRVGRGNELEARGKHRTRTDPAHDDPTVLDGLTQSLQGAIRELGKLVEKEDAIVSERYLAGSHVSRPSPDERGDRRRMMRRAKGTYARRDGSQVEAGDRVDERRLDTLVLIEWR